MSTHDEQGKELSENHFPIQYLEDLSEETTYYLSLVIGNVYRGVSQNINPDGKPGLVKAMLKAGFFSILSTIGRKLKQIVGRRVKSPKEPFTVKGGLKLYKDGRPMTVGEWDDFNRQVIDYMRPYIDNLSEEMSVKTIVLAMATAEAERQGQKPEVYGKKGYAQIEKEQFDGYVPDTIEGAEQRIKIPEPVRKELYRGYDRVAMYVQNISDDLRQAIRKQVVNAYENKLTHVQLASNMYWMKVDDPAVGAALESGKISAESMMRDWRRIAHTELAMLHAQGKTAAYEAVVRQSFTSPKTTPRTYWMFVGGTCPWCQKHQGIVMLQIPDEMVGDEKNDALSARDISDPHTDRAYWPGKNNVGLKQAEWMVCVPAHPWNKAQLVHFDPNSEKWDSERRKIVKKREEETVVDKTVRKQFLEHIETAEAEKRARQDRMQADRIHGVHKRDIEYFDKSDNVNVIEAGKFVERNGQRYESVPQNEFGDKLDAWRADKTLPIPVGTGQRAHRELFGS